MAARLGKADLINLISEHVKNEGIPKKDVTFVVNAFFETVADSLARGDEIRITGFGSFAVRSRAARKGYNPRTKEEIDVPEKRVPAFKPGRQLKEAVAANRP